MTSTPETAPEKELSAKSLLSVFGGGKGLFDSSIPALVFVLVNLIFDNLNAGIIASVSVGVLIVAVRRVRGESLQQAFSGFFGLLIAVLIARATGTGKGFFWPGVVITGLTGVGFGISLLIKKPAIALGLVAIDRRYAVWPTHARLRRACTLSTIAWMVSFFIRAAVGVTVLLAVSDSNADGLVVLVVVNAVKWPLIIGAALLTVALVKQAEVPPLPAAERAESAESVES